jgi:diadenylate cyclase
MIPNPFQNDFGAILIELAVIWVGVYLVFRFLQGTRGAGVIRGLGILGVGLILLLLVLERTDSFNRLELILNNFIGILAVLLIVIFQPELRQAAIRIGQAKFVRGAVGGQDQTVDAIAEAVEFLSRNQFGAIIAIERNVQLGGLVEGGQQIDAIISERLLESIFWPSSPLHDLGVVVRGNRIVAAGVQFPLAEEGSISANFGSRHRAGLGLVMESDCVVVIVSEETGGIAIGVDGGLETRISNDRFKEALLRHLVDTPGGGPPGTKDIEKTAPATTASEAHAGTEPQS